MDKKTVFKQVYSKTPVIQYHLIQNTNLK